METSKTVIHILTLEPCKFWGLSVSPPKSYTGEHVIFWGDGEKNGGGETIEFGRKIFFFGGGKFSRVMESTIIIIRPTGRHIF